MEHFFIALAILTVVASLMKFIKKDAWWIRFFDFPQAQLVLIGFVGLAGLLYYWWLEEIWQIVALVVLLVVLVYESTIIYPYTILAPKESKKWRQGAGPRQVSLIVANVYMHNRNYAKLLQLIYRKQPDIIIAVETDELWAGYLSAIEDKYPFQVKHLLDNAYGISLYSKLELINPKIKFMVEEDVPSIHSRVKLRSGEEIMLYGVHPKPPSPTENEYSTERDAELYLIAKEVERVNLPVIVAGDLNDVAWSRTTRMFQKISRLLDPRKGRGFFNTFHVNYPIVRWPLDHVFYSDKFRLSEIERLPNIGSDHFPMFISVVYTPETTDESFVDEADREEREEANEKIREV